MTEEDRKYRRIIDELVDVCKNGQGKIGSERVIAGVWNRNARKDFLEDQYQINELLKRLNLEDRKIIAEMLEQEVRTGIFEALKVLEDEGIPPFERGYEGSPYHDFIGRMDDWKWPERTR